MSRSSGKAWCDFCGKREDTVVGMVEGGKRHICDICVQRASDLLRHRVMEAWRTDVIVRLESFDAPRPTTDSESPEDALERARRTIGAPNG